MIPLNYGIHHYKNRSLPASAQSIINWYAEPLGSDAKTNVVLHQCPGLALLVNAGAGKGRGCHVFNGVPYAVIGETLYSFDSTWTATAKGAISGSGRVWMASSDSQLVITTGSNGYVYDGSLAEIMDVDWFPSSTVEYLDGYFVWVKDGTGDWFISNLLDGTSYDSSDYGTSYGHPDNAKAVIPFNREAWVFGEKSIEIFYNQSDGSDFPFIRNAFIESKGLGAVHSIAKGNGNLVWLGHDWVVYKAVGYEAVNITDATIEHEFSTYEKKDDAFAYIYHDEGHTFYQITFPTEGATWVCDLTNGLWHQRAYRNPQTNEWERHHSNGYMSAYGKHVVIDHRNGNLYQQNLDIKTDNGDPLVVEATFPPIHANGERVFSSALYLDFETGIGNTSGQGSDPQAMLDYSDDGGRTFGNERWTPVGKIGEYKNRVIFSRMGSFINRIYRVRMSAPVKRTLIGAYMR